MLTDTCHQHPVRVGFTWHRGHLTNLNRVLALLLAENITEAPPSHNHNDDDLRLDGQRPRGLEHAGCLAARAPSSGSPQRAAPRPGPSCRPPISSRPVGSLQSEGKNSMRAAGRGRCSGSWWDNACAIQRPTTRRGRCGWSSATTDTRRRPWSRPGQPPAQGRGVQRQRGHLRLILHLRHRREQAQPRRSSSSTHRAILPTRTCSSCSTRPRCARRRPTRSASRPYSPTRTRPPPARAVLRALRRPNRLGPRSREPLAGTAAGRCKRRGVALRAGALFSRTPERRSLQAAQPLARGTQRPRSWRPWPSSRRCWRRGTRRSPERRPSRAPVSPPEASAGWWCGLGQVSAAPRPTIAR